MPTAAGIWKFCVSVGWAFSHEWNGWEGHSPHTHHHPPPQKLRTELVWEWGDISHFYSLNAGIGLRPYTIHSHKSHFSACSAIFKFAAQKENRTRKEKGDWKPLSKLDFFLSFFRKVVVSRTPNSVCREVNMYFCYFVWTSKPPPRHNFTKFFFLGCKGIIIEKKRGVRQFKIKEEGFPPLKLSTCSNDNHHHISTLGWIFRVGVSPKLWRNWYFNLWGWWSDPPLARVFTESFRLLPWSSDARGGFTNNCSFSQGVFD